VQLYRRIAELQVMPGIADMETELADRFGPLPRAVQGLLFQMRVKLLAQAANATAVDSENGQISIRLPYLATADRTALQAHLGHDVRVSRTAIWLPYQTVAEVIWQDNLLEILAKLQIAEVQTAD
jgi:transcription-repair coupling factor (superfamily II helicase)